jgi:hypothetical protein
MSAMIYRSTLPDVEIPDVTLVDRVLALEIVGECDEVDTVAAKEPAAGPLHRKYTSPAPRCHTLHMASVTQVCGTLGEIMELELPEIRAWARAELSAYSDGEIDRVIREWSSTARTRCELLWLEWALAKSHATGP